VTVCVTNYNGKAYLGPCLDALAAMDGEVAEIIVVDNNSTDGSLELLRARDSEGPPLRVISMPDNDGPCTARNVALAAANTRWVFQLDSDVVVQRDTLTRLLPEIADPDVAMVMPRAVLADDPSVIHYDGGHMHYVGVMCLDRLMAPVAGAPEQPRDVDAVICMALLLDREVVRVAGGFDEAFFILFEDHDLSYRLRVRGLRLRHVPGSVVLHLAGTPGISFRPGAPSYPERRAFLHARNRPYLVLKNYSWAAILATLPGRSVYALVYLAFAARRGVLVSYLKGRFELLGLLPRALRLRRQLRGCRVIGDRQLLMATDITISPVIERSPLEARLEKSFNGVLRAWWRAARWLIPESRTRMTRPEAHHGRPGRDRA
jgi:GT2 family glycosyltransferase